MDEVILQRLVDRLDIEDVLTRYPATIDVKDFAGLRPLLTDDARARYGVGEPWMEGGDTIAAWIEGAVEDLDWQHHMVSVYEVQVDGDEAKALVYLLSHQTVTAVPDQVRMMTSRYRYRLRRTAGAWRISELDLEVGWYEERNANQKELLP